MVTKKGSFLDCTIYHSYVLECTFMIDDLSGWQFQGPRTIKYACVFDRSLKYSVEGKMISFDIRRS